MTSRSTLALRAVKAAIDRDQRLGRNRLLEAETDIDRRG